MKFVSFNTLNKFEIIFCKFTMRIASVCFEHRANVAK
jgi:hypothetical protein